MVIAVERYETVDWRKETIVDILFFNNLATARVTLNYFSLTLS